MVNPKLPKHGQNIVRIAGIVEIVTPSGVALLAGDPDLEIARGDIQRLKAVNQPGRSTNVDAAKTDVWDGANASDDIKIWVAPTTARIHQITSSSASDDGSPVGVGARTIEVAGLTSWDTKEVSEVITLNGVANVPTINSYVIIHRMKVLTKGPTSPNVGVITAIADVDGTVTAQINAGIGRTQMAVYGVPSIQTAFVKSYYATVIKNAAAVRIMIELCVNPESDVELIGFITEHSFGLDSGGSSDIQHFFDPPNRFPGPTLIKIQADSSAANSDVSAGLDMILADN